VPEKPFDWQSSMRCVTPDGYEAQMEWMGDARTGGVIVRVVPPWDKPFLCLFQVSKDVGRDVERLIQQHRCLRPRIKPTTARGSQKAH
jgi:hypothetical protein